jgi:hypothetical protein
MTRSARFETVSWLLVAVLSLAPTGVLAAQDAGEPVRNQLEEPGAEVTPSSTEAERSRTGAEPAESEAEAVDEDDEQNDAAETQTEEEERVISGMSVLGNQEAPTSLVIVPWKSSQIGDSIDVSTMLDDSRQPVDREVFMRELRYYEIRSETKP